MPPSGADRVQVPHSWQDSRAAVPSAAGITSWWPVNFDHEQRFQRIVAEYLERPAGDYAELLHRGYVTLPPGVDPEEWRADIRAQARKDKIRVMMIRDGDRAIAARRRVLSAEQEHEELRCDLDRHELLRSLKRAARKSSVTRSPLGFATTRRASRAARGAAPASTCALRARPSATARRSVNPARPRSLPAVGCPGAGFSGCGARVRRRRAISLSSSRAPWSSAGLSHSSARHGRESALRAAGIE